MSQLKRFGSEQLVEEGFCISASSGQNFVDQILDQLLEVYPESKR